MAAGRPRLVHDTVILRAAVEVMGRAGPDGFTLAAVAREAGLAPATLVQRFGSKHGLLLALAEQSAKDATAQAQQDWRAHGSVLAALAAFATTATDPLATPERFANHLAFLCLDLTDPQLHEHALAVHQAHGQVIGTLLAAALAGGELRPGTDVPALTAAVQAAIDGTGLSWALDRRGGLGQRIRDQLSHLLAPYRLPRHSTAETAEGDRRAARAPRSGRAGVTARHGTEGENG